MTERFNPYKSAAIRPEGGNGVLITTPNHQPEIRRFTEENRRWDFQEEASKLYRRAETVMERFYPIKPGKFCHTFVKRHDHSSSEEQNVPIVVELSV